MSHIIGRPGDNLLDIMLGDHGADPEQAFIGDGAEVDDHASGDEPPVPEQEA